MISRNKTLLAVCRIVFILFFVCGPVLFAVENNEPAAGRQVLQWSQLPDLPNETGVAGPFAGVHNDAMIVAGGANFPEKMPWDGGEKVWYDNIYVLKRTGTDQYKWFSSFKLDRPLAYGASLTTEQGIICIGGCDADKCYNDVFILKWDSQKQIIKKESLPSLPRPCAFMAAVKIGDVIYVAGGQTTMKEARAMNNFWALDLSKKDGANSSKIKWEQLPPWPGQKRI